MCRKIDKNEENAVSSTRALSIDHECEDLQNKESGACSLWFMRRTFVVTAISHVQRGCMSLVS